MAAVTLQFPFSGLSEEFVVTQTREAMQYRYSGDHKVATAGIKVHTGRKWSTARELQVPEARLKQRTHVETVARGLSGLGCFPSCQEGTAKGKEHQNFFQEEVCTGVEEVRPSKMVGLRQQGAWTRWKKMQQRKIPWPDLGHANGYHISFLVQAVYDTLTSPANLHT